MPSKPPQDIVAIFHTSFHPTRGNVLDWYFSVDNDLDLDNLGLEFSALPSGLHQLDEDVVYFTTTGKSKSSAKPQTYHAIALFRRRRTTHPLYRGFLLGSLGVLVAGPGEYGPRARSWRHLPALREVAERCYSRPGSEPSLTEGKLVDLGAPEGGDWFEPAREYFESRKARALGTQESWTNWKDEIYDEVRSWMCSGDRGTSCAVHSTPATLTDISPTLALPSLLTLLGPASLTLYRHLLTRKRILIYTKPPVEYACVLCYAAVDMVRSIQEGEQLIQQGYKDDADEEAKITLIPPKHVPGEATRVLGMVTLHDLLGSKFTDENDTDADDEEGSGGRGWIACTTDALFLEKPAYYDLLIDLTSVGVSSSSTVAFTTSKSSPGSSTTTAGPTTASWMFGANSAPTIGGRIRPTMYVSVPKSPLPIPIQAPTLPAGKSKSKGKKKKGPKENKKPVHYKRVPSRWAWSDARLWGELDKVLRAPPNSSSTYSNGKNKSRSANATESGEGTEGLGLSSVITTGKTQCKSCGAAVGLGPSASAGGTSLTTTEGDNDTSPTPGAAFGEKPGAAASGAGAWLADAWQLYEDVCLVCAGAWMGTLRTRNLGLGVAADGEGYGEYPASPGGAGGAGGSILKRSVSTPLHPSGAGAGRGEYRAVTMPAVRRDGRGHAHTRSVSASAAGEARKREKYAALLEEGVEQAGDFGHSHTHGETSHIDAAAAAVGVSNETEPQPNQDAGDHYHDHDFTLVAPPTPDTREGLDILLHTAALHAVFPSNLNLADAVTKTEGILAVLDGYADTVVGVLRRRVLGDIGNGSGLMEGAEESEGEGEGEGGTAGEGGHTRGQTSAIELTSTAAGGGGGVSSRRSVSPPVAITRTGSGGKKKVKAMTMTVTPRDLLSLDLNPLSAVDVKYLESVQREYASRVHLVAVGSQSEEADAPVEVVEEVHVGLVVKRGWRDLVGVVFGL